MYPALVAGVEGEVRERSLPVVGRPGSAVRLPLAAAATRRHLPLADTARTRDETLRPRLAVWELTLRCNLACHHCGSRAGKAREDELTTEECLVLVDELAALSVQEVSLIGGEAHLHPGFLEVLRALKAHGIEVGMTTGGRGIDPVLAHAAAEAGLDSVSISVDGLEASHDALRALAVPSRAPSRRSRHFGTLCRV
jgi:sulfatase maturation enzyme AslB (radical SAM superfamily)